MFNKLAVILAALWLSGCATHVITSGRFAVRDNPTSVEIAFTSHDRSLIHDYYREHARSRAKKTPPGLAKRGQLPPGLGKRDTLPPGLQGRDLPGDLEARLSPLPAPYMRVNIGDDLVLLNRQTRVVMDVVRGVTLE